MDAEKISLIVECRETFEMLKKHLQSIKIANELSVILISVREQKVLEEYVVPLLCGEEDLPIFYNKEACDDIPAVKIDEVEILGRPLTEEEAEKYRKKR